MSALRERRLFAADEYLLIERRATAKSELIDGQMWAMAGASEHHMLINRNLSTIAHIQLRGSGCLSFANEMKVLTKPGGMFAYPDLVIVCGERLYHDDRKDVLLNPTVLFEVLSPSTESFDRHEKFLRYQELDSLTDYVLVSQSEPHVERFERRPSGVWTRKDAGGLQASLVLCNVTMDLVAIYENVFS